MDVISERSPPQVIRCSEGGAIENPGDAPRCVGRKKKMKKKSKVKELLVSDWKANEKRLRKDGHGVQERAAFGLVSLNNG